MKLTSARVRQTLDQFQAQPIPSDHPAVPELNRVFGEHTFFVNEDGLHVVEVAGPLRNGAESGTVVKLARWKDEERTRLAPQTPEPIDVVVILEPDGKASGTES